MCVSALSPPELTASSSSGKTSGAITFAGCRTRADDRAARRAGRPGRRPPSSCGSMASPPTGCSVLVVGALERAAGLGEEDVVERRLVQLELRDRDVLARRARARSRRGLPGPPASRTATPRMDATGSPKRARIAPARSRSRRVCGNDLDGRAADLRLQRGRRALGDDPAVVDDPDAVGEHVGLLEVLRGQEDGHALVLAPAARPPPRARSGSGCRARWSARRGRGCAGGGRARARGRAGASSRRSSRAPCGRPPRRGRPGRAARRRAGLRSARGSAWSVACRRRCSRPVSSGSSAASCSAAPIDVAHLRALASTTSKPPTRAIPDVGGSRVVSMSTVVDLPAPFGPRKP